MQRLDRLIAGYLMEVIATHQDPDQCRKSISSFARTLTVRVAMYLAKLIASLFRPVLYHPCMILTDDDTEPLLTSQFWVRPVYEELLTCSVKANLVKVASHTKSKSQGNTTLHPLHAHITDWIGADCPVDFLNVWFPAHWAPIVFHELQGREQQYRRDHALWFDAPARSSDSNKLIKERADALKSRVMHYQLRHMDCDGEMPTPTGKLKVDWIDFPLDDILEQFTTLKEGILRGTVSSESSSGVAWLQSGEGPGDSSATWRTGRELVARQG